MNTIKGKSSVPTGPIVKNNGQEKTRVYDDESVELLESILLELKILNVHMNIITEDDVRETDISEE